MRKNVFVAKVKDQGDSVVTFRSPVSKKLKYNVCTMDFNNKYIKAKPCKAKPKDDEVLLFCWDTDSYRLIKYDTVIDCAPLSRVLRNDR